MAGVAPYEVSGRDFLLSVERLVRGSLGDELLMPNGAHHVARVWAVLTL